MTPRADWVLGDLARVLAEEVAPHAATYQKAVLTDAAVMLGAAASAWDGAAHMLRNENQALCALFRDAASMIKDAALAADLRAAGAGDDEDIRVSALQAHNEALRSILIVLHEQVELMPDETARVIEAAIWRELAAATAWRRTPYDTF